MAEEKPSARADGVEKILKAGKPLGILSACLVAFSTVWVQLDALRKELAELNAKMVYVANNKEAITRLENLLVKHIDGPISHPEVEAKLLILVGRVDAVERELRRLTPRVEDGWTAGQHSAWAAKLGGLNPGIKVP